MITGTSQADCGILIIASGIILLPYWKEIWRYWYFMVKSNWLHCFLYK
jgi:hypothetical protein